MSFLLNDKNFINEIIKISQRSVGPSEEWGKKLHLAKNLLEKLKLQVQPKDQQDLSKQDQDTQQEQKKQQDQKQQPQTTELQKQPQQPQITDWQKQIQQISNELLSELPFVQGVIDPLRISSFLKYLGDKIIKNPSLIRGINISFIQSQANIALNAIRNYQAALSTNPVLQSGIPYSHGGYGEETFATTINKGYNFAASLLKTIIIPLYSSVTAILEEINRTLDQDKFKSQIFLGKEFIDNMQSSVQTLMAYHRKSNE